MERKDENIHQGDVYLVRIEEFPEGKIKHIRNDIVAFGEITGHAHKIEGCEIVEIAGKRFCCVKTDSVITHQQHPKEDVSKGNYEIRIQKEYFPEGLKNVID